MAQIARKFPGKPAAELYGKVDDVMRRMAEKHGLAYETSAAARTGQVKKMGIVGSYSVRDGEVVVDLKYPMLVPGGVRKELEASIEKRLDGLYA